MIAEQEELLGNDITHPTHPIHKMWEGTLFFDIYQGNPQYTN